MSWSLDWFAAKKLARAGTKVRRVGWTDHWLVYDGLWFIATDAGRTLVTTGDFGKDEFFARDWTDEAFNANPCAAVPAYNTSPITYGQWTSEPIQLPPPVPGFPSL